MSEERNATQEPGDPIKDPSYSTNQNEPVPVTESADDLGDSIDPEKADSDEQLEQDDTQAIDKNNILDEKTRGAAPVSSYQEPDDLSADAAEAK